MGRMKSFSMLKQVVYIVPLGWKGLIGVQERTGTVTEAVTEGAGKRQNVPAQ
jgi:hypothetical protein